MRTSRARASAVIAGGALVGMTVGWGVVAFAGESPEKDQTTVSTSEPRAPAPTSGLENAKMPDGRSALAITSGWSTNEFGLTVGSPTVADIRAGNLPDLVPSQTDDGKDGFLIAKDNYFPLAKNPTEALAYADKQRKQLVDGERIEQIVGPDGRTPLGTRSAGHVSSH